MHLTDPHARSAADCLQVLDASVDGLTAHEAARRLSRHGPNRLPQVRARGPLTPRERAKAAALLQRRSQLPADFETLSP